MEGRYEYEYEYGPEYRRLNWVISRVLFLAAAQHLRYYQLFITTDDNK